MRILKVLHTVSHLRWIFLVWMIGLIIYIFYYKPDNSIQLVGTVIFISGIMMGLTSLSDITKISDRQKKELSNPKIIKRQLIILFASVIILIIISACFLSQRLIHPTAEKSFINDFMKLGYDCLIMMLGFLCLIKQFADKVDYVKSLNSK